MQEQDGELQVSFYRAQRFIARCLTIEYRYEYVKRFEQTDYLLPNTWVVVRIDGRGFTKQVIHHKVNLPWN